MSPVGGEPGGVNEDVLNSSTHIFMVGKSHRPLRRPDRDRAGPDVTPTQFPGDREKATHES